MWCNYSCIYNIYVYIYTPTHTYIYIYIKAFYFKKLLHSKSAVESLQGMVSSLSWALSLPSLWPGLWTSQCALWPTLRAWRERSTHVHDPRPTCFYGEFLIPVLMKTWGFIYIYCVRINRSVQHFYIKALSLASFQRSSPTDKSACTQQVVTFHGSGAQQQLTWKHSGIAQQQTELLGNSPKQQRDAQQERRAWSQLRQCGGLSTQWQNNMQQPHQQIQMEQMHSQQ